ncbi:hypothetical protein [uncultured Rubinisphaera sp.]|uniref:hypothetical protein n=1 Tax=uncultured Rubinisphaera sp. TaxID=1678686 RepID=UPI0030D90A4A
MINIGRRQFLHTSALLAAGSVTSTQLHAAQSASAAGNLHLAPFRFDVSPPLGHPLCGGWIKPVIDYDDPLEAIGFVLLGAGDPIVICAVDWTGLLNEAHVEWRKALAEAAGTTPDRVAVQCVHQHNAPFACLEAERLVAATRDFTHIVDLAFYQKCLDAGRAAIEAALKQAIPITHIAQGEAAVEKVAGNRRIIGLNGLVVAQRGSSSRSEPLRRYPEGLIDPMLKTVAFYYGEKKVAACHYYACHPMSYYGDGRVSADFCGLARRKRQADEPDCLHIYFNGCGGNIGAGKYNNGSPELRPVLTDRIYAGILASEAALVPEPIQSLQWTTTDILPPPDDRFDIDALVKQIEDPTQSPVSRNRPAYTVSYTSRFNKQIPITLSALHVNQTSLLHLPSESFVEYQLRAQGSAPNRFVACAAYGDGGPWYVPTKDAYPQGGYAVSVAWCDPQIDTLLSGGVAKLLETV